MFTTQSKSQLAKLLAVENITVEHRKMQTAKFDVKNRVLYCPIWKEMSSSMYDLLMGHEVGHALFTPADGWHDAICEKGANYKSFLNVIEDARIEKKVKRKYPGIKRPFVEAYTKLIEDDFFGLEGRDVNNLPFIDRVNLFTKLEGSIAIKFTDYEQTLVDRVLAAESWNDVTVIADEIYGYSKDEQQSMDQEQAKSYQKNDDDEEEDSQEVEDSELDSGDSEESEESDESVDSNGEKDEESDENEDSTDSDGEESDEDQDEEDFLESNENFEPSCGTDDAFRNNEIKLLDETSKEYIYLNLPKINMDEVLTPAKVVHQRMTEFYKVVLADYNDTCNKALAEFKNKNSRYISLLAKEFEMKKSAKCYSKSKVSETGDIDLNKIYKYQVEDNLFRKLTIRDKGKSHGLVLFLDKSGSMRNNMGASIEQILVLTMFCRKVNIPFVVYGFGNSDYARIADYPDQDKLVSTFSREENNFVFLNSYLREYLSSSMKTKDYNDAVKNLLLLKNSFENRLSYPRSEALSSTPLIESMVALQPIVKQFKKTNNLDIVNLVLVNDGDADEIEGFLMKSKDNTRVSKNSLYLNYHNFYLVDKQNKYQAKINSHQHFHWNYDDGVRIAVFEWFKKTTGCKIFGFFLGDSSTSKMKSTIILKYKDQKGKDMAKILGINHRVNYKSLNTNGYVTQLLKRLKEDKFLESFNEGYDTFFILPGGNSLSIEDEELAVSGNITVNKLKTAFSKLGKLKSNNRVLVSKFIKGIS
jgi:hypothetical protein